MYSVMGDGYVMECSFHANIQQACNDDTRGNHVGVQSALLVPKTNCRYE
jgi:hypothetical protein